MVAKTISGAGAHASAATTDRLPASKAGVAGYLTPTQIQALFAATDAQAILQASTSVLLTPANLAGRASFKATKSGNQASLNSATHNTVTFDTETWDTGNLFASNAWVPPAGKVRLSAQIAVSGVLVVPGFGICSLYKNGSEFLRGTPLHNVYTGNNYCGFNILDSANGTDSYTVNSYEDATGTYQVDGTNTWFCGEQV